MVDLVGTEPTTSFRAIEFGIVKSIIYSRACASQLSSSDPAVFITPCLD